jgi:hypothetical protein
MITSGGRVKRNCKKVAISGGLFILVCFIFMSRIAKARRIRLLSSWDFEGILRKFDAPNVLYATILGIMKVTSK